MAEKHLQKNTSEQPQLKHYSHQTNSSPSLIPRGRHLRPYLDSAHAERYASAEDSHLWKKLLGHRGRYTLSVKMGGSSEDYGILPFEQMLRDIELLRLGRELVVGHRELGPRNEVSVLWL